MKVEDEYRNVLKDLEFGVVDWCRRKPGLTDYGVMRVFEALIEEYKREGTGTAPKAQNLSEIESGLKADLQEICEFRLGRIRSEDDPEAGEETGFEPITKDVLLLCLKRLLKSAKKWNKSGGRQGYLDFINSFFA